MEIPGAQVLLVQYPRLVVVVAVLVFLQVHLEVLLVVKDMDLDLP